MTHPSVVIVNQAIKAHRDSLRDALAYIAYNCKHHSEHDLQIIFGLLLTSWLEEDHNV